MKKIKNKKWILAIIATFFICYIPRMLMGFILSPYPVYDEGPVLSTAAYFAGKDWSGVAAVSAYYGFGYYGLFAPLFKITDNPNIIYFVIIEVNAFVQALYGLIAFKIIRKFFKINNLFIVMLMACISGYLITVRPILYNEIPLVFLVWCVAYVLCELVHNRLNRKRKNIYSIVLFFILAYALTIHTRALILLIGISIVVFLYLYIYKEWLISLKVVPVGVVFIVIANWGVKLIQNIVWKAGERVSVANTSINLGMDTIDWLDVTTWKSILYVVIGQINTINLVTGGLFVMSIYILIKYVLKNWQCIREQEEARYYLVLSIVFLLCCLGMIVGQAMSWMYAIYPNLEVNKIGNVSGYKAFSYIRYLGAFMGPFVLGSMVIMHNTKDLVKKKDIFFIIFWNMLVLLLWYECIFPLLEGNAYALEPYVPFCFRKPYTPISLEQYRVAIPWNFIFIVFIFSYFLHKNMKIYYGFVLSLLIFHCSYMAVYNDAPYGKDRGAGAAVCYEFVTELEENCEIPKEIYSYQIDRQRLQFFLNDYRIEPKIPEEINENTVFIYQGKLSELENVELEKWNIVLLEKNIYFFFQKKEYINLIKAMGHELL